MEILGIFGIFLLIFSPCVILCAILWNTIKLIVEALFIFMGDEELIEKKKMEAEEY